MSDLHLPGQNTAVNLPATLPLVVTNVFHQCEPVFVRVTDATQNLDHGAPDTVTVTITEPKTSVTQVLRLTETGNDTGVFVGYIVTTGAVCTNTTPPSSYNGFLPASES